jgi:hypothetical protein
MSERVKPDCCDCCMYETPQIQEYQMAPGQGTKWLCHLCADSMAGRTLECASHPATERELACLIMNAANHIIEEIRKLGESAQPKAQGSEER